MNDGSPTTVETKQAVLVLGMHRSGTSALARILNLMGVELGSDLLPPAEDNESGFWEHRKVQFIHDRIYEALERDWTNVSPLPDQWWTRPEIQPYREQLKQVLLDDFGNQPLWGMKDPRLCAMLPLWKPLLAEIDVQPKCVMIFRNPAEIARSLEKRDGLAISRTYLLWLRCIIDAEKNSRGLPRTLLSFEQLLADWQAPMFRITADLNMQWPVPPQEVTGAIAEFIKPSSRHHQVGNGEFLDDERIPKLVRQAFSAVLDAVDSNEMSPLSKALDDINEELNHTFPLLNEFIGDLEKEHRTSVVTSNKAFLKATDEVRALHKYLADAHVAVADLKRLAADTDSQLQTALHQVETEKHNHRGSIAHYQNMVADLKVESEHRQLAATAEINSLRDELADTIQQHAAAIDKLADEHRERLNFAKTENEQLSAVSEKLSARVEKLEGDVLGKQNEVLQAYRVRDTLGASLHHLFRTKMWKVTAPVVAIARALGALRVNINQLVPLTVGHLTANGTWEGIGAPQFLVPTFPVKGWVRLRTKVRSSVSSRACLYFDTGPGFHEQFMMQLSPVAGETIIDRLLPLRETAYVFRFDPIQAHGEFAVEAFTLEPVSRLWVNLSSLWKNLTGQTGHRPSISLGMKMLLRGEFGAFHRQLMRNATGNTSASEYDLWRKRHFITDDAREKMRAAIATWQNPPTISVVLPVYNVAEKYLRECIDSVMNQIYPHWELCIADDASPKPHVKKVLNEYAELDKRIKVVYRKENGNIAAASNSALQLASGEYSALLDHDDTIAEHALFKFAESIVADRSLDMIYSDEDKLSMEGKHVDPFFKPDWSPEYFMACMYTCHLGVYRTELVKRLGGWRSKFDGAQDYDLVLRIIATNPKILHIPDVLYHWRTLPSSTASGATAKPEAHFRAQDALADHLKQIGREGTVEDGPASGFHRVRYAIKGNPKVSIVIPSACKPVHMHGRDTWLALECVASIRKLSTYKNIEIIVLDDNKMDAELETALKNLDAIRIPFMEPFNFSKKINVGCYAATGSHLVMMNDDVEVISPDWIESMLEYSQWDEIGAVGAQLLFPDNTQQHTGVTILDGNPGHPFYHFPADHPGYYFSSQVHRNWSAVTAACMMTRADVFKRVGGLTESFPLNYNDVDYCLKVLSDNKRVVYMPYAKLYHHESITKSGTYAHELEAFKKVWKDRFPRDPYYNPNLNNLTCDFRIG